MFVGDSLSLNMWNSLGCMIHASVPTAKISYSRQETLSYVTFKVSHSAQLLFASVISVFLIYYFPPQLCLLLFLFRLYVTVLLVCLLILP